LRFSCSQVVTGQPNAAKQLAIFPDLIVAMFSSDRRYVHDRNFLKVRATLKWLMMFESVMAMA
jgi:hypothetical protein